jgi:hypothetical protein
MRIRVFVLACASALLVSAGFAAMTPAHVKSHKTRPRIKSGRYGDGTGDAYLYVNVRARTVAFQFRLYCNDLYADQWVTSGPKPVKGELTGNRRGATAFVAGEYHGTPASGPGTSQDAFWSLKGKFTNPAHFEGRVEYEAATFPEPVMGRPQCLDAALLHLGREPGG